MAPWLGANRYGMLCKHCDQDRYLCEDTSRRSHTHTPAEFVTQTEDNGVPCMLHAI